MPASTDSVGTTNASCAARGAHERGVGRAHRRTCAPGRRRRRRPHAGHPAGARRAPRPACRLRCAAAIAAPTCAGRERRPAPGRAVRAHVLDDQLDVVRTFLGARGDERLRVAVGRQRRHRHAVLGAVAARRGDRGTGRPQVGLRGARQRLALLLERGQAVPVAEHVELGGDAEAQRIALRAAPAVGVRIDEAGQQGLAAAVDRGDAGRDRAPAPTATMRPSRTTTLAWSMTRSPSNTRTLRIAKLLPAADCADGAGAGVRGGGIALRQDRGGERGDEGGDGGDFGPAFHVRFLPWCGGRDAMRFAGNDACGARM